jgi:hypothetical protein
VTDHALPDSGPEREIFLQALRRFSDECESPNLIAECPFSIDLPEGGRGCGEECLEILGRFGRARPTDGVPIGATGIAAHSMGRPRRPESHAGSLKPFDAAELFYRDSDNPDRSRWHSVSLLKEMKDAYVPEPLESPDPDRLGKLAASTDELRRRRFDVDDLLRNGLHRQMALGLTLAVAMRGLIDADLRTGDARLDNGDSWGSLLDAFLEVEGQPDQAFDATLKVKGQPDQEPLGDRSNDSKRAGDRFIAALTGDFTERLRIWAATAPLDDLINRRPPTLDEFLAIDLRREPELGALGRRPRWLIDRFTETYLGNWDNESLKLEWRYQQGLVKLPWGRREMAARSVDPNQLAHALAEAAASPTSDSRAALLQTAVRLLIEGNRSAAAAVYDAARQEHWDDPVLHNNYGFCLLPDNPSEALAALELAANLGTSLTVNVCNRMLALFMLGRHAAALELADRALANVDSLDVDLSYLWDFTAAEPKLLTRECPRCYLVKLAVYVADASGDELAAARWSDAQSRLPMHSH